MMISHRIVIGSPKEGNNWTSPRQARVVELKNKCEAIERREAERRAVDERKRKEEIDFLKQRAGKKR